MALATLLLAVAAACGGDGDEASTAGVDLGEAVGSDASGSSTTSPSSTSPSGVTTTSTPRTTTPTPVPLAVTDVGVPGAAPAGIDACSQPVSYESTNLDPCDATTSTVSLRIDGVTAAPVRDFTAISEVAVHGA